MIKTLLDMVRFAPLKTLVAAGLAACLSLSGAVDAAPVNLSTGINTTGGIDNIWTIASTDVVLSSNKLEILQPGFPVPPWVPDTPGVSQWLVPVDFHQRTAPPNVDFQYSTTFNLTAADLAGGVTLAGRYLSDNQAVGITLTMGANSTNLGPLNSFANSFTTWTTLTALDVSALGWGAGSYKLEFDVHNGPGNAGNPTGFRFEGGYGNNVIPEPASLVMGALSTLALGGLSWKRRVARHG